MLTPEKLWQPGESQMRFEARYDAINTAYTGILRGGPIPFHLENLQRILTSEEFQALQAISEDRGKIRDALWAILVSMTEDE